LDGTYQGANSMITPSSGLSGASGRPITIRALNDGLAVLDGQFVQQTVSLYANSWWVLEGFNAKNGSNTVIYVGNNSNNNIFRRIVAWDAHTNSNSIVFSFSGGDGNLVEDVALFGAAGRSIQPGYGQNVGQPRNVLRRVWARYEGSIDQTYAQAISLNYGTWQGATCENCLATYSLESLPSAYYVTSAGLKQTPANNNCSATVFGWNCPQIFSNYQLGFLGQGGLLNFGDGFGCDGAAFYGSLGYIVSVPGNNNVPPGVVNASDQCLDASHVFAYVHPNFNQKNSIRGFNRLNPNAGGNMSNLTSVSTLADNITGGKITVSGARSATTFAGLSSGMNPWTGDSGAQLCKRWVNGVLTKEPLWPWPMNQRIKDATASAGNYFLNGGPGCGSSAGDCTAAGAGPAPYGSSTRTATDVTADIEALLGTIPASCREP
jgi:hypothetical protein